MIRWAIFAIISVSGILAYQMFLWNKYGDFWVYFKSQDQWAQGTDQLADDDRADAAPVAPRLNPLAELLPSPLNKAVSIGAWNKLWTLLILGTALVGLYAPGPFPRAWYVLPIGIFLLGYLPAFGARWDSIARFDVAALPSFLLIGYWASARPRIAAAVCLLMFVFQLFTAYAFTRGVWAG